LQLIWKFRGEDNCYSVVRVIPRDTCLTELISTLSLLRNCMSEPAVLRSRSEGKHRVWANNIIAYVSDLARTLGSSTSLSHGIFPKQLRSPSAPTLRQLCYQQLFASCALEAQRLRPAPSHATSRQRPPATRSPPTIPSSAMRSRTFPRPMRCRRHPRARLTRSYGSLQRQLRR
jgi:hypothetical protein